jgi:hypothetical protein
MSSATDRPSLLEHLINGFTRASSGRFTRFIYAKKMVRKVLLSLLRAGFGNDRRIGML